jgi:4-hydroxy-2-oxoheptanedioate aldolase
MSIEQVPMLIQQGFRAIAVQFDVWGLTRLVHTSLKQGREYATQAGTESNSTKE